MQIEAIPMLINSDFMEIPLDKRLDLADYKMYGERSHVFQNKDRLHSLYECVGLTMNDLDICGEAFDYFVKNKRAGIALAAILEIEAKDELAKLSTIEDVLANDAAMAAIFANDVAMTALSGSYQAMKVFNSSKEVIISMLSKEMAMSRIVNNTSLLNTILESDEIFDAMIVNPIAMKEFANSYTAMEMLSKYINIVRDDWNNQRRNSNYKKIKKLITSEIALYEICKAQYKTTQPFIKLMHKNIHGYIDDIYNTVIKSPKFKYISKTTTSQEEYNTPNTFIFGEARGDSNYYTTLFYINNEFIKAAHKYSDSSRVDFWGQPPAKQRTINWSSEFSVYQAV